MLPPLSVGRRFVVDAAQAGEAEGGGVARGDAQLILQLALRSCLDTWQGGRGWDGMG